jgi:hypothetical protein
MLSNFGLDPEAHVLNDCKKFSYSSTVTSFTKNEIPNTTSVGIIMKTPYRNAKLLNLKRGRDRIGQIPLLSKRRTFWNEKTEQLATKNETCKLDKTTIRGIIDVSWTLRKTSLIVIDAR